MIHYLVSRDHRYTMDWFLACEPSLGGRVAVLPYEELDDQRLEPGTYVFADLERFTDAQLEPVVEVWQRLSQLGDDVRLLNNPSTLLRRYDLLRALHERGVNSFTVHRLSELIDEQRMSGAGPAPGDLRPAADRAPDRQVQFPVFLREERDHTKDLSPLIDGWASLYAETRRLLTDRRYRVDDLLAVEWCDTSDGHGVYRKYAAFVVGSEIVARSLMSSREWVISDFDLAEEPRWREAREYVATNPDADRLLEIARAGAVDYGRIDYARLDGRVQVWEINTNPCVIVPPDDEIGFELHRVPMRRIAAALIALDQQVSRRQAGRARRTAPVT
jgi:hypothetical protein